jgi:hypothetical protein
LTASSAGLPTLSGLAILNARLINRRITLDAAANLIESSLSSSSSVTFANPSSTASPAAGRIIDNISPRSNPAKWTCYKTNRNYGDTSYLPPSPWIVRRYRCRLSSTSLYVNNRSNNSTTSCPVLPSLLPPTGMVTGVFLFHTGLLKNCWYACPSSHILFGGYAFFCLTFPPRLCLLYQPYTVSQCALIFRTILTVYLHRCPSTPSPTHRKPSYLTIIPPYGGLSGPGNLTSETSRATSSKQSTYRWIYLRSSFVVRSWFLAKCAAAYLGTTAVRHLTHTIIRCRREWRKNLVNVSP